MKELTKYVVIPAIVTFIILVLCLYVLVNNLHKIKDNIPKSIKIEVVK